MDPERSTLIMPTRSAGPAVPHPRLLAGRYRTIEEIGRGGMSTVYRARDEVLDREVAVKILLPSLAEGDPAHVARFEREARAAAALAHPSVVKVYDTGQDREIRFIVMEYVAGQGLDQLLAKDRKLEPDEATRIAGQVAGALAAAHAAGILHRDVKPANVMLTPAGEVKVLDFGIARARQDPTLTQPSFAIGTAAYMSPERVLGQAGDERSDIYSLGCLLFVMLTGRPPFVADSALSVLHQQVHAEPVAPTALGAGVAPPLEALILRMLAKDPAQRPQSAAEVAGRLGARHLGQPRAASVYRLRRWPPMAAVAISVLLVLVVALVIGSSGGGRSQAAHRPARALARRAALHKHTGQLAATATRSLSHLAAPAPPAPKHTPPGHGGVPPGHAPGGPPGHHDKPPKAPEGPHGKPPKAPEGPHGKPPHQPGDGGD